MIKRLLKRLFRKRTERRNKTIDEYLAENQHMIPKNRQQRRQLAKRHGMIKDWSQLNS